MSISEKISDDLTKALKSGDRTRLSVLRMIKSSTDRRGGPGHSYVIRKTC
jgi:uncharacterized protein YqeY